MQWFKHMSNMSNNLSVKRLIRKYGLEGYGLYCYIVERIVYNLSTNDPMPNLDYTCDDIADETGLDVRKVNDIANFMINEGLLSIDEITTQLQCVKVYKYLESSQTRSPKIRQMIDNFKNVSDNTRQTKTFVIEENKNKNKKENNIYSREESRQCIEIVDYLNKKTGKSFKSNSKATKRFIVARLNEKYTIEDFKKVIDNKCEDWLEDKKMNEYLRPQTLFGTKFESYLNQKSKIKENKKSEFDVFDIETN